VLDTDEELGLLNSVLQMCYSASMRSGRTKTTSFSLDDNTLAAVVVEDMPLRSVEPPGRRSPPSKDQLSRMP
jgi:hypothetical protein